MGIVPIWGFQMLTAMAVSILFRLNKALVIIAANISIPPLIPVVLYVSHLTGSLWMGEKAEFISFDKEITFETVQSSLVQYLVGAVSLAVVCGFVFGLTTYVILKFRKRVKSKI